MASSSDAGALTDNIDRNLPVDGHAGDRYGHEAVIKPTELRALAEEGGLALRAEGALVEASGDCIHL